MKMFPIDEGGMIGPMKSRPYFENEKSTTTGCKGRACNFYLPTTCSHSLQLYTYLYEFEKIVGQ